MQLTTIDSKETVEISDLTFNRPYSEALIHQVVTAYRNAGRAGTKAQKSRSDLSGTTKKSKKQKGGGARHGDLRAPIFVGGGVTFAARPRSFAQKVNRKMYRTAMQSILSELARQGRLQLVTQLDAATPKTRDLLQTLKQHDMESGLLVTEDLSPNLYLAARNVPKLGVIDVAGLDPVSLVSAPRVLMTVDAAKKVEAWLG